MTHDPRPARIQRQAARCRPVAHSPSFTEARPAAMSLSHWAALSRLPVLERAGMRHGVRARARGAAGRARLPVRGQLLALQAQQVQHARDGAMRDQPEGQQPQQHHLRAPGHAASLRFRRRRRPGRGRPGVDMLRTEAARRAPRRGRGAEAGRRADGLAGRCVTLCGCVPCGSGACSAAGDRLRHGKRWGRPAPAQPCRGPTVRARTPPAPAPPLG